MSEADSGWYLRHRDGVEHGPFRLADIVTAAEAGNVADDTSVRHAAHTRGEWVVAPRVQPIATAMSRSAAPASPAAAQSAAPQPTPAANPSTSAAGGTTKSAFRRPSTQPPSALPGSAPYRPTRAGDPARAGDSSAATQPDPAPATKPTQNVRIYNQTFPVPKRFLDAAMALFDFRFRYFITPWIIKILWGLTVGLALIWFTRLTYDFWIQPSLDAPGPRPPEGASGWQFEPLAGQSVFRSPAFIFAFQSGTLLVWMLLARVVMETIIVFFRVAQDIAELKRSLPKDGNS